MEAAAESGTTVKRLSDKDARSVEDTARAKYVRGNPRVWWLGLEGCESYDSNSVELSTVIPDKTGACWFLPETDEPSLPVYEVDASSLPQLIKECPYFEFNIVAKDFSWLVAESDHNVYFLCRSKAEEHVGE